MLVAQFTGEPRFKVTEIPMPICPNGGVLIKVDTCTLCGTDLKVLKQLDVKIEDGKSKQMNLPRITGHEVSGVIIDTDSRDPQFNIGDKVVVFASVPCGECYYCKIGREEMCSSLYVVGYDFDGGFAEYMAVPKKVLDENCLIKIPECISMENAALAEPLSCAINGLEISPVKENDTIVVIGGGTIGNFFIELSKIYGARQAIMIEKEPEQLATVNNGTADYYILNDADANKKVLDITEGRGADVVITACSVAVVQKQALEIVAKCGYVNFFGGLPRGKSFIEIDSNIIHYKECAIVGTHGSRAEQARKALSLLESKIDGSKYISERYALKNINDGVNAAFSGSRLKIAIKP